MSALISPLIGAVTAILTLVLGKDYLISHDQNTNQLLVKNGNGDIVAKIPLKLASYRFFKTNIGRGNYNKNAKTVGNPTIIFTNPYKDKKVTILGISLVPDANFKTHGIVEIDVNKRSVLDPSTVPVFADITDFQVPLPEGGLTLDEGETIDVYLWNDDNVTTVTMTTVFAVGVY